MREKNIVLEEETRNIHIKRRKNSHIIEDLLVSGILGKEISELNRCRQLLHETCLSVMSTGDSKYIST